jgi:hypothetical protein
VTQNENKNPNRSEGGRERRRRGRSIDGSQKATRGFQYSFVYYNKLYEKKNKKRPKN